MYSIILYRDWNGVHPSCPSRSDETQCWWSERGKLRERESDPYTDLSFWGPEWGIIPECLDNQREAGASGGILVLSSPLTPLWLYISIWEAWARANKQGFITSMKLIWVLIWLLLSCCCSVIYMPFFGRKDLFWFRGRCVWLPGRTAFFPLGFSLEVLMVCIYLIVPGRCVIYCLPDCLCLTTGMFANMRLWISVWQFVSVFSDRQTPSLSSRTFHKEHIWLQVCQKANHVFF